MPKPDEVKTMLEEKAKDPNMPEHLRKLVRNPKLAEAFSELSESENSRNDAKGDPAGWLKRKGVPVPEGARVRIGDDAEQPPA